MQISIKQLERIRDIIQEEAGIFIEDEKLVNTYKKKIEDLVSKRGYRDFESFLIDLKQGRRVLQELINVVTINETYFFREEHQFATLLEHVIPELHGKRPKDEVISILSAPCSTGEELYSIAIFLMEEGRFVAERDFLLLGIDVDSDAIERAREGVFSKRSVHRVPRELLKKYFVRRDDGFVVRSKLKAAVNFRVANVMDKSRMRELGTFDVIFSRNMLIYFSGRDQVRVLETFHSIMKPGGYLFLGHAEKVPPSLGLFEQVKLRGSFVYKKV